MNESHKKQTDPNGPLVELFIFYALGKVTPV